MSKCDELGHWWCTTTSCGWYQCHRSVQVRTTKRGSVTMVRCGMVAYCPGCLGVVFEGVAVVFCSLHTSYRIEQFTVVSLQEVSKPTRAVLPGQLSFW